MKLSGLDTQKQATWTKHHCIVQHIDTQNLRKTLLAFQFLMKTEADAIELLNFKVHEVVHFSVDVLHGLA